MQASFGRAVLLSTILLTLLVPHPVEAVTGDGGALAWGLDQNGQVGDGAPDEDRRTPVGVSGLGPGSEVLAVEGGLHHSLAVLANGTVLAWGRDDYGQLGSGGAVRPPTPEGPRRSSPAPVFGLGPGSGVVAIAAGGSHSLALRADGTVLAWGSDGAGQLGDGGGFGVPTSRPQAVRNLGGVIVAIDAGLDFSLALRSDGTVLSWGHDLSGQLGDGGPDTSQTAPVVVSGLGNTSEIVGIAAGYHHGLALRMDGTVLAWGGDSAGALGDGEPRENRTTPVPVSGLPAGSGVVAVAAGGGHSLVLRADGSILSWGSDGSSQLGDGDPPPGPIVLDQPPAYQPRPVPVVGLGAGSGIVELAGGGGHSLALRADGKVLAWGSNDHGELGRSDLFGASSPVTVAGLEAGSGVTAIAGGGGHSLAAVRGERQGYAMVSPEGDVWRFGSARFWGSTRGVRLNRPVVGMSHTPSGNGYSLVASDGGIFGFGDFRFFGSPGGIRLNQPIVGMESTPSGNGYWLVASDGGIFAFGDAKFFGSTGSIPLNKPVVGMERTPSGNGYWLVASDGGIFAFGDARFAGSTGGIPLNKPMVGMSRSHSGNGYLLVASDGGIFGFGDAAFHGSTGGVALRAPVVGIMPTPSGAGYWLCARDGGIFGFGDGRFWGSVGSTAVTQPVVGCDAPRRH